MNKKSAAKLKMKKSKTKSATRDKMAKSAKKLTAFKKPLTKSNIVKTIADITDVKKAEVSAVLETLNRIIEQHVSPKATAGAFILPGLLKIQRVYKPAKRARKGINPFTGEETTFKAKPAHHVIKIRALKKLKDMVK